MYSTVLRLGLWLLIAILGLYVVREANAGQDWVHLIEDNLLKQGLMLSGVIIVAGIVLRFLGKGAKVIAKPRCAVCKTPVPAGAIYCRAHLRSILHEEDDRRHEPVRRR